MFTLGFVFFFFGYILSKGGEIGTLDVYVGNTKRCHLTYHWPHFVSINCTRNIEGSERILFVSGSENEFLLKSSHMRFFWLNDLSQNIWKNVGKQFLPNTFLLAEFSFQFLLSKRFQICAYDHWSLVKAYLMLNTGLFMSMNEMLTFNFSLLWK